MEGWICPEGEALNEMWADSDECNQVVHEGELVWACEPGPVGIDVAYASSIGAARMDGMLPENVPVSSSFVAVSRRGRLETEADAQDNERALNERALSVLRRVKSKLGELDVAEQVKRLILEAQSNANLCQLYIGWCPFW